MADYKWLRQAMGGEVRMKTLPPEGTWVTIPVCAYLTRSRAGWVRSLYNRGKIAGIKLPVGSTLVKLEEVRLLKRKKFPMKRRRIVYPLRQRL